MKKVMSSMVEAVPSSISPIYYQVMEYAGAIGITTGQAAKKQTVKN